MRHFCKIAVLLSAAATAIHAQTIHGVGPNWAPVNSARTVTIIGTGFISGTTTCEIDFGTTQPVSCTVDTPNVITATIPAQPPPADRTGSLIVRNLSSGDSTTFTLRPAGTTAPSLTSLSITSRVVGSGTFDLGINGTGFSFGTVFRWITPGQAPQTLTINGTPTSTSVIVAVPASLMMTASNSFIFATTDVNTNLLPFNVVAPSISSLNPTSAFAGSGNTVLQLNGSFTSDGSGETVPTVRFIGPAGTSNLTPSASSETQLTVTIPSGALLSPGSANVRADIVLTTTTQSNARPFTIQQPAPTISGVTPGTVARNAATTTFAITGTNFTPGSQSVTFTPPGGSATGVTILPTPSPTAMSVSVPNTLLTALGTGAFVVTTTGGGPSNSGTITIAQPVISTLNPPAILEGSGNTVLAISGTNFSIGGSPTVEFTPPGGSPTILTPGPSPSSTISVTVPSALLTTSGNASVRVISGTAASAAFTLPITAPTITLLSPNTAVQNSATTTVTITGTTLTVGGTPTATWIPPGGTPTSNLTVIGTPTATSLQVSVPNTLLTSAGTAQIFVTSGTATSNSLTFTITGAAPNLTASNPADLAQNTATTVTLTGTNLSPLASLTFTPPGGSAQSLTPTSASATSITVNLSAALLATTGTGVFTVTTSVAPSATRNITIGAPAISSVSPLTVLRGGTSAVITVNGTFNVGGQTGTARWISPSPGPTSNFPLTPVTAGISSFTITAAELANAGAATVQIVAGGAISNSATVTVIEPAITSFNPTSAVQNSATINPFIINGVNLNAGGTPVVRFTPPGGSPTVLTLNSSTTTSISAILPAGLLTASGAAAVTVQTGTATSAAANFTISAGGPTISNVNPAASPQNTAVSVTLTGTNFTPLTSITFTPQGGSPITLTPTSASATSIVVPLSAAQTAVLGAGTFTVTTPAGSIGNSSFTIDVPVVSAISPLTVVRGGTSQLFSMTTVGFGRPGTVARFASPGGGTVDLPITAIQFSSTFTAAAAQLQTAGVATVRIVDGGAISNAVNVTIVEPVITNLNPSSALQNAPTFNLILTGSDFTAGGIPVVRFTPPGGSPTALTLNSSSATSISAIVPTGLLSTTGIATVTVQTGTATSAAVNFSIGSGPAITSLSQTLAVAGAAQISPLVITGANFTAAGTPTAFFVAPGGSPVALANTAAPTSTSMSVTVPASLLTTAGAASVFVRSGPSTDSPNASFTIANAPVLEAATPLADFAGAPDLPITVFGLNFTAGGTPVVRWTNGANTTTLALVGTPTATLISATIPAALLANPGSATITIQVGGVNSTPLTFTIFPTPVITLLSPASATAGSGTFALTISGANLALSGYEAVVRFNTTNLTPTSVSATSAVVNVPAALIATAGVFPVTVTLNPLASFVAPLRAKGLAQAGRVLGEVRNVSNVLNFTVNGAGPTLTSLNPASVTAGSASFALTIVGSGFAAGDTIDFGGTSITPSSITSTSLTATVPATAITTPADRNVRVLTAAGIPSNSLVFRIRYNLISLSPAFTTVGGPQFALTANASAVNPTAQIVFNGNTLTTTSVTSTSVTANVPAALITAQNSVAVSLIDGTLVSNSLNFSILGAVNVTSLNPSSVQAGSGQLPLTVTGSGFDSGSTVLANNNAVTSTFVSATQMTATIPAGLVANAGAVAISVRDSNSRVSNAVDLQVLAPISITTLNPSFASAGGATFNLTVNGSGFANGMTVFAGSTALTSTFGSATQMTATVPASLFTAPGSLSITVRDATRTSNASTLPVLGGLSVTSLNPSFAQAGFATFVLTVSGASFDQGSTVLANGSPLSSQFVSATQMTATVPASLFSAPGSIDISVRDSNQRTSNAVALPVLGPLTTTSLNPAFAAAGSANLALTVTGTAFDSGSVVLANGSPVTSAFVSVTQMTATVPANLMTAPGSVSISVRDSRNRTSNAINLPILGGLSITSLNPTFREAGTAAFTLTINGSAFDDASVVLAGTQTLTTSFVSGTQLQATVPAALIATAGSLSITVRDARSRTSNAVSLPILEPIRITSLSAYFADAGAAALQLTVAGRGFESVSVVNFNGTALATQLSGATLQATIPANLLAAAGTATITVADNRGRTSNGVAFNVFTPLTITSLSPSSVEAGAPAFTLTVNGTGFREGLFVTRFGSTGAGSLIVISSSQASISIPAEAIATAGPIPVSLGIPVRGEFGEPAVVRQSNTVNLQVLTPLTLTSVNPSRANAGVPAFNLTVGGQGFTSGAVIRFNNTNLATTFVNATTLTGIVNPAQVTVPGNFEVRAQLADGRISTPLPFVILPQLRITQINPPSSSAGANGFNMTVTGEGFTNESVVRFGGFGLQTTFVSATQLTALVSDAVIANPTTADITVANPLGAISNAISFSAGGSISITSINPAGAPAGSNAVTIAINGNGFTTGTVARFGNTDLATTFVGATQLNALIPAQLLTTPGNFNISAAAGATVSNSVTFEVGGKPELNFLNPDAVTAGSRAITIIALGRGFLPGAVLKFGDDDVPTTFASGTQVSAVISAALLANPRTVSVSVVNPNGSASNSKEFRIAALTITTLTPDKATVGSAAFSLAVEGTGFINGAIVSFGGRSLITSFGGATRLTGSVPADALLNAGRINVTVSNPDGAVSNALPFTIESDTPSISRINPNSVVAGSGEVTIAVTGGGFVRGSSVTANGNGLSTTFNSATSLDAVVPADLVLTIRNLVIKVVNPGNKESNEVGLSVTAPTPAITSITPPSVNAGTTVDVNIAIAGSGFIQGSSVTFNGSGIETSFTSATSLSAVIPASALTTAGNAAVQVVNPGNLTSNTVQFNILGAVTVTSVNPATLSAGGSSDPVISVAGTGFVNGSTVLFGGAALPTVFGSATSLSATVPQNLLTTARTVSVSVRNPNGAVSNGVNLTVAPPVPALSLNVPATITPAGNGTVAVTLAAPAPVALQGTLTMNFVNNSNNAPNGYFDPALAFAGAAPGQPRVVTFTIAQGATTAVIPGNGAFSPGTVAGTISILMSGLTGGGQNLLPNPAPTRDVVVDRAVPVIVAGSVRITNVTGGFQVELNGISSPRDLRSITYTFTASGTSILEGSSVTVDVSSLFTTYFATDAGRNAGGTFRFTMPFTVAGGDAAAVTSVSVTATNSVGTSTAVSGGR